MQQAHNKLKEIIWEITGECKNNCTYCGSKDVWDKKNSNQTIINIAQQIASYPPLEITISGGDPLLVEDDIHQRIVNMLKEQKVVCKILLNPKSLFSKVDKDEIDVQKINILNIYDWVGVSINTKDELNKFQQYMSLYPNFKNLTIITNFNIQNLFLFDTIESFVLNMGFAWTIQFTVYDKPSPLALYSEENCEAFSFFKEKYEKSLAKIILSDNIRNDMPCGAGWCSAGITYDGFVVPCLSMRSWTTIDKSYPNLFSESTTFKYIWQKCFTEQRFGEFMCCKDHCGNKSINPKKTKDCTATINDGKHCDCASEIEKKIKKMIGDRKDEGSPSPITNPLPWQPLPDGINPPNFPNHPLIIMYGVHTDQTFYATYQAIQNPGDTEHTDSNNNLK